jgi:L-arabinose isomerase
MVQPFWRFWQHVAPVGHADRRRREMDELCSLLQREGEKSAAANFLSLGLWDVEGSDQSVVGPFGVSDVVLLVITMAAPPQQLHALLSRFPKVPLVLCALDDTANLPENFDHAAITTRGATVGLPMLTSILTRSGRPYQLVVAAFDDASSIAELAAACAEAGEAGRISHARLGRIGNPQRGYSHVDASDAALTDAFGLQVVRLSPDDLVASYRSINDDAVRALSLEVSKSWDTEPTTSTEAQTRSLRSTLALQHLVQEHRLDAGSLNCHVPEIRLGSEIGIAPCFALGTSTSDGVPWTCTGDVLTAVAMLVAQVLSGSSLYHELEAMDACTGEFVVANTGEHDLAWIADGARPRLCENHWFRGVDEYDSYCASHKLAVSTATLLAVSYSANGRLRLVSADGAITGRGFPAVGTPHGAFRFASGPARIAWGDWIRAGVNHHSALAKGHLASAVERVSSALGIEHVTV